MNQRHFPFFLRFSLTVLVALTALTLPAVAAAQDAAVVQRLIDQGQMSRNEARSLVRSIDRGMAENAARGGDAYDDLRQKVNAALFGANAGPGGTQAEYQQRFGQVMSRLRSGLDLATLQTLFSARRNGAVLCAHTWGVTIGECDALIAAATMNRAVLPYLAPDDGRALQGVLRAARIRRRVARSITSGLREAMLAVPRSLQNNADGRLMLQLLADCPGGTTDREAQVRAWHVGPTEGMARCIAESVARRGGPATATRLFGMNARAAEAFVTWGGGSVVSTPDPAPVTMRGNSRRGPPRTHNGRSPQVTQITNVEALRNQGNAFARAGRWPDALRAFEAAAVGDTSHLPTFLALARVRAQLGDLSGTVEAYRHALSLDENNDDTLVLLGRAYANNGQNAEAIAALQQAMHINYDNMTARNGLRALGGEVPNPPLPETPPRDAILATMQPLRGAIGGCAPQFSGGVAFAIEVHGETGEVFEVTATGEMSEDERYCMESVVLSARFPRFTQEILNVTYPFMLVGEGE